MKSSLGLMRKCYLSNPEVVDVRNGRGEEKLRMLYVLNSPKWGYIYT